MCCSSFQIRCCVLWLKLLINCFNFMCHCFCSSILDCLSHFQEPMWCLGGRQTFFVYILVLFEKLKESCVMFIGSEFAPKRIFFFYIYTGSIVVISRKSGTDKPSLISGLSSCICFTLYLWALLHWLAASLERQLWIQSFQENNRKPLHYLSPEPRVFHWS